MVFLNINWITLIIHLVDYTNVSADKITHPFLNDSAYILDRTFDGKKNYE